MPKETIVKISFQRKTVAPRSVVYIDGKKLRAGEQYIEFDNGQLTLCPIDTQDINKQPKHAPARLEAIKQST